MTNTDHPTTPSATSIAANIAARYEGLKFAPLPPVDRSRNQQRTAPRTTHKRRTIR